MGVDRVWRDRDQVRSSGQRQQITNASRGAPLLDPISTARWEILSSSKWNFVTRRERGKKTQKTMDLLDKNPPSTKFYCEMELSINEMRNAFWKWSLKSEVKRRKIFSKIKKKKRIEWRLKLRTTSTAGKEENPIKGIKDNTTSSGIGGASSSSTTTTTEGVTK